MAPLYEFMPTQQRLQAYTEILSNYEPDQLSQCLKSMLMESNRFPEIGKILKNLNPQPNLEERAMEMATEIFRVVREIGSSDYEAAKKELGDVAMLAVQRAGGLHEIGQTDIKQLGTLRAQLRDICKATIMTAERSVIADKLLPYEKRGLKELGRLDFSEFAKKLEIK